MSFKSSYDTFEEFTAAISSAIGAAGGDGSTTTNDKPPAPTPTPTVTTTSNDALRRLERKTKILNILF